MFGRAHFESLRGAGTSPGAWSALNASEAGPPFRGGELFSARVPEGGARRAAALHAARGGEPLHTLASAEHKADAARAGLLAALADAEDIIRDMSM